MKIEKLPSGSYRVRKMYKGQNYTLIFDYKPTQKEIIQAISQKMDEATIESKRRTFKTAAKKYIEVKENVLSPSTISSYEGIIRNLSEKFVGMNINEITQIDIQKEINDYAVSRSPKTVRNAHGLIIAVMKMFRPNMNINTTLPQKEAVDTHVPTDEDVKKILEYAKGTEYEIPLLLATLGLRRSEICALTSSDVKDTTLTINKAKIKNNKGEYILKTTKTTDSTRTIHIPQKLADMITEKGYVYKGNPNLILRFLHKAQSDLGIEPFKLHALRHYYASVSHTIGIPDVYIMASGGWKTDNVMKRVYRHAQTEKKEQMQNRVIEHLSQMLDE